MRKSRKAEIRHDGYITWDEGRHMQRLLEANVPRRDALQPGSARRGFALLSGLLRCGRCGRRLFVAYSGTGGRVPQYACQGGRVDRGAAACLSIGSLRVDRAVVEQLLEAIQPAGIDAALMAMHEALHDDETKRQAIAFALAKARYEARSGNLMRSTPTTRAIRCLSCIRPATTVAIGCVSRSIARRTSTSVGTPARVIIATRPAERGSRVTGVMATDGWSVPL
jgi:hypothetical protein